jgi:hypothetical protein
MGQRLERLESFGKPISNQHQRITSMRGHKIRAEQFVFLKLGKKAQKK